MIEVLMPLYRITEWRENTVFRTEPAGERWLPWNDAIPGYEIEPGLFVGTPDSFQTRRVDKSS